MSNSNTFSFESYFFTRRWHEQVASYSDPLTLIMIKYSNFKNMQLLLSRRRSSNNLEQVCQIWFRIKAEKCSSVHPFSTEHFPLRAAVTHPDFSLTEIQFCRTTETQAAICLYTQCLIAFPHHIFLPLLIPWTTFPLGWISISAAVSSCDFPLH